MYFDWAAAGDDCNSLSVGGTIQSGLRHNTNQGQWKEQRQTLKYWCWFRSIAQKGWNSTRPESYKYISITSVAKKKCKCKPWHCTNASTDCSLLSAVTFQSRLGFVKESFVATFRAGHGKDKRKKRNAYECVKWRFFILFLNWTSDLLFLSVRCRLTLP